MRPHPSVDAWPGRESTGVAWGEKAADTLFDPVTPAGHELATRQDVTDLRTTVEAMERRWDERTTATEERWEARIGATDERWDQRLASLERRLTSTFERRITLPGSPGVRDPEAHRHPIGVPA